MGLSRYISVKHAATQSLPMLPRRSLHSPLHQPCAQSISRTVTNTLPLISYAGPNLLPIALNTGAPIIKTQARAATILPNFLGLRFAVHNGKTYEDILITEEMVGRKLGEFVP
jgi:Ribosomal protein S19